MDKKSDCARYIIISARAINEPSRNPTDILYSCVFSATWGFKPRSTNFLKFQINYHKIKLYKLLKISKSCPFLLSRAFKSAFNSFEAYNVTEIQGLPFFWNGLQEKLSCISHAYKYYFNKPDLFVFYDRLLEAHGKLGWHCSFSK